MPADVRLTPVAQAMLDKVRSYGNVSIVELQHVYESFSGEGSAEGDQAIEIAIPNLWIWAGASEGFAAALEEIRPLTKIEPAHWLVYVHDGAMLRLPLAKRPPKNGYREPHWAPVVLNPLPEHARG